MPAIAAVCFDLYATLVTDFDPDWTPVPTTAERLGIGHAKPSPAIYLLACQRLDVHPARVLFVGDGGSDELRGARQARMAVSQATWFLERWPGWKTVARAADPAPYSVLRTPAAVVEAIRAADRAGRDA